MKHRLLEIASRSDFVQRIARSITNRAKPPQQASFGEGHPQSPLTQNLRARRRFGEALHALAKGSVDGPLAIIDEVTDWRPGLAPLGEIGDYRQPLEIALRHRPENLSLRVGLAEAYSACGRAEDAAALAISAIRDSRPHGDRLSHSHLIDPLSENPELGAYSFHPIDLGVAFKEGDHKTAVIVAREMLKAHWPALDGKSVLDIGSFTGWFAFEAERRGAASVTANDFYCWMVDFPLVWRWIAAEQAEGRVGDPYQAPFPVNDPDRLPGRRTFDLTRAVLKSRVTPVFGAMETADLEPHDVVLLLGVLYHTEDPLGMLRRVFDLTGELLIIETLSFESTANLDTPFWRFYGDGLRGDVTTVWAPSSIGLRDALLKVGFSRVELLYGWDGSGYRTDWPNLEARLWVHAYK